MHIGADEIFETHGIMKYIRALSVCITGLGGSSAALFVNAPHISLPCKYMAWHSQSHIQNVRHHYNNITWMNLPIEPSPRTMCTQHRLLLYLQGRARDHLGKIKRSFCHAPRNNRVMLDHFVADRPLLCHLHKYHPQFSSILQVLYLY